MLFVNSMTIYQVLGTLLERQNIKYSFCLKEIHYLQIMSQNQEIAESFLFKSDSISVNITHGPITC